MEVIILTDEYSLKKVCGLTLFERTLLTCAEEGLQDFMIVTNDVPAALSASHTNLVGAQSGWHIKWMSNQEWLLSSLRKERSNLMVYTCLPKDCRGASAPRNDNDATLTLQASSILFKGFLKDFRENSFFKSYRVRSEEDLKMAEKLLLSQCRKPTDGVISKHLNRSLSLQISRILIRLPITANQMTGLTLLVGLVGAYCAVKMNFLMAFLIFQITSILDGCDGEIARLKFQKTKYGAWLDTVSDNIIYVTFIFCFGWGMAEFYSYPIYLYITLLILALVSLALVIMYSYLKKKNLEGTLVLIERHLNQSAQAKSGFLNFFPRYFSFVVKRDFFAFVFFVLALGRQWQLIFWLLCLGSFFIFVYSLTLLPSIVHRKYGASAI